MTTKVFRLLPGGDSATGMQPSNFADQDAFTTADKREVNHTFFQTEDGSTLSGVWECAPCREKIDAYPAHEMMTVLAGSVTLTNADGSSDTFTAGDTFFIAKGTQCIWEITETLRKYYMISE